MSKLHLKIFNMKNYCKNGFASVLALVTLWGFSASPGFAKDKKEDRLLGVELLSKYVFYLWSKDALASGTLTREDATRVTKKQDQLKTILENNGFNVTAESLVFSKPSECSIELGFNNISIACKPTVSKISGACKLRSDEDLRQILTTFQDSYMKDWGNSTDDIPKVLRYTQKDFKIPFDEKSFFLVGDLDFTNIAGEKGGILGFLAAVAGITGDVTSADIVCSRPAISTPLCLLLVKGTRSDMLGETTLAVMPLPQPVWTPEASLSDRALFEILQKNSLEPSVPECLPKSDNKSISGTLESVSGSSKILGSAPLTPEAGKNDPVYESKVLGIP